MVSHGAGWCFHVFYGTPKTPAVSSGLKNDEENHGPPGLSENQVPRDVKQTIVSWIDP